ncbi:MAG: FISUMP domain-containing protein, partial [Petrimonas sp.]|nr:FISUMP domain-containing protein [Petrimonas sp.]
NGLVSVEIGSGTVVSGTFATIDWSNGPYFIKTETDPTGGTSYTITGTSQLLSVPYALHAKTAESVTGGITETDPVYSAWDKTTGISITESQISDLGNYIETETDPSVPTGTTPGEMQYWNGTAWVTVAATENEGATLQMIGGIPTWVGGTPTPNVTNPTTGEIWMDRNLGASQVATSSTDAAAYGDLYQWGRAADGHESRTSGTTSTLATSDTPGHGNFISIGSSPYDWRNPQNDNLWQGVSGTNNPCPSGYRLPTEAEWEAERTSWSSNNEAGAFASPLKLPVAGGRSYSDVTLGDVGSDGYYWSSTVSGTDASFLIFDSSSASMGSDYRALGFSVRCLKD